MTDVSPSRNVAVLLNHLPEQMIPEDVTSIQHYPGPAPCDHYGANKPTSPAGHSLPFDSDSYPVSQYNMSMPVFENTALPGRSSLCGRDTGQGVCLELTWSRRNAGCRDHYLPVITMNGRQMTGRTTHG